jgi:hypothetical protein
VNAFRADDRVLLLAIPTKQELAALARVLIRGTVVALGTADEVAEAKPFFADFENVMLLDAPPDKVPWRGAGFNKIIVPHQYERILAHLTEELERLLAPGGEIVYKVATWSFIRPICA